ncbi:hypothetical protein C8T65DRAFT_213617 [Cerioporus squamosus]|nr:hypothetical protein C8T65DRAFT_213617 [Cerioporus squamosus]
MIDHNMARIKYQVPDSPLGGLNMNSPDFLRKLVMHVRQTLKAYIVQDELYKEASVYVKQLTAQITEIEDASSTKIAELQKELADSQDENGKLRGERDQLRVESEQLRVEKGQLCFEKEQLCFENKLLLAEQEVVSSVEGLFTSEMDRMEAEHAGKMATSQAVIDNLTADINSQRAAHVTMSSELEGSDKRTSHGEEKERERLLSLNRSLERQIEELKRKVQEQGGEIRISRKHQDANVQTPSVIRFPAARKSVSEDSAALRSKRSHSRMEEGGAPTATGSSIANSGPACGTGAIPEHLAAQIAVLPAVTIVLPSADRGAAVFKFTRNLLQSILGGNRKQLVSRLEKERTPLASQYNIQYYLCASRSRYAWLPSAPRQHGFLPYESDLDAFAGRTSEIDDSATLDETGTACHLFVGNGNETDIFEFEYYGLYRVTSQDPLTKEDWALLPVNAQTRCIDKKIQQLKGNIPAPGRVRIRSQYTSGELRVPCARLQCIAFDVAFYKRLVEASAEYREPLRSAGLTPGQQLSEPSRASKRRRVSDLAGGPAPSPQIRWLPPRKPDSDFEDMYA